MAKKLKKTTDKKVLRDIQIAAGMVCLGFLKNDQQQAGPPQQGQPPAPQGQPPQPQQGPPQAQGPQPPQQQQAQGPQPQGSSLPQGLQAIAQVLKGANDPAAAIAHVIYIAISKVKHELDVHHMKIDSRVWIMGGGVVDRVLVEILTAVATVLKFQPAMNPQFNAKVKSDLLDLMEDDDQNGKAIKVLHDNGLPMPKPPMGAGQGGQQQPPQGLAAPQGAGAPQGGPNG